MCDDSVSTSRTWLTVLPVQPDKERLIGSIWGEIIDTRHIFKCENRFDYNSELESMWIRSHRWSLLKHSIKDSYNLFFIFVFCPPLNAFFFNALYSITNVYCISFLSMLELKYSVTTFPMAFYCHWLYYCMGTKTIGQRKNRLDYQFHSHTDI